MDAPLREAVNDVSNGKSLDENADKNREFYFGQLLLAVDLDRCCVQFSFDCEYATVGVI